MEPADLAARYAPILWIHETDHHLPEDWRSFFSAGTIQLCENRQPLRTIGSVDDFLAIPSQLNTPAHALDLAELNLEALSVDPAWPAIIGGIGGQGLQCVREGACKALGNNRHVNTGWFNPARANAYQPRLYWRLRESLDLPDGIPGLRSGRVQLLQYFFFTIYNDHFNQHECDWDATLHVVLSEAGEPIATAYSFHEDTWLVQAAHGPIPVVDWLQDWGDPADIARQTLEGKLPIGNATVGRNGLHLWSFIASGSHGGYPTPGYTMTVAPVPEIPGVSEGGNVRLSSDDRAIGQTCLYPSFSVGEAEIRRQLHSGGISDRRLRPIGYTLEALEEVDDSDGFARWRGLWGERVASPSWSGPLGPTHQEKLTPGSDLWLAYLRRANSFGTPIQQLERSVHAVRPHDLL